jgi:type VII secretion protein EccE
VTSFAWPPRPARRVAGIPVGLLVCWQLAALLGLAAIGRPPGPAAALLTAAALLLVTSSWRVQRRWGCDWFRLWVSYRLRRRRLRAAPGAEPELELLRSAAGVRQVSEASLGPVDAAVVDRADGSTVVLEISRDGVVPEMLTLPATLLPEPDPGEPDAAVQLLLHIRPTDAPGWRSWAWLAVQVFRDGDHSEAELRHALCANVRRVRRRLRQQGYAAPPLSVARLRSDVRLAAQLDLAGPRPPDGLLAAENWHHWWTPGLSHATLRVTSWTPLGTPSEPLVAAMLTADGLGTTVALGARHLLRPAPATALELVVRLTERTDAALATAVQKLHRELAATGAAAERLDGRAAAGLATTLPLGGFAV